jgi:hypothetical protein
MRIRQAITALGAVSFALLPGGAGATSTTCATTVVCAEYINTSSGVAIHGEANTGIGIRGTSNGSTGFYGASRSGNEIFPGVEGESLNNGTMDSAGAFGLTGPVSNAYPSYGVLGFGSSVGALGSTSNPGASAHSGNVTAAGVAGYDQGGSTGSDANVGVIGLTSHGVAVLGDADASGVESSLFGGNPIGVIGDAEPDSNSKTANAFGVLAISKSYPAVAYNPSTSIELQIDTGAYTLYEQEDQSKHSDFSVDTSGNIEASSLTTILGSYARKIGASGTARTLYAPHATSPVTEDFGEGQLVNGRGYVRLDPALADLIDNRNAYHVFLTPEGDSKGLYVTQKSPAGFLVRESSGGRSTLAFEYRILAKPLDENGKRLALAPPRPHMAPLMRPMATRSAPSAALLDPFTRLKLQLGPAAYERALKAARLIEAGR